MNNRVSFWHGPNFAPKDLSAIIALIVLTGLYWFLEKKIYPFYDFKIL